MNKLQYQHNQRIVTDVQNPKDLNRKYTKNWLDGSNMPHKMDPSFRKEKEFSGIDLDDDTMEILRDCFHKYLPAEGPGGANSEARLDPAHL